MILEHTEVSRQIEECQEGWRQGREGKRSEPRKRGPKGKAGARSHRAFQALVRSPDFILNGDSFE